MIKAQIFATGRFKAGGIKFADNPDEAEKIAAELIGAEVKGMQVDRVLVEEKLDIDQEFYTGVIVDVSREVSGPVLIFSTAGGVDIEEAARETPEKVARRCGAARQVRCRRRCRKQSGVPPLLQASRSPAAPRVLPLRCTIAQSAALRPPALRPGHWRPCSV